MNSKSKNRAIVRDPGTVFVCWETDKKSLTSKEWIMICKNIATAEESIFKVKPNSGKQYIHSLNSDSYYSIIIAEHNSNKNRFEKLIDFGTVRTFKSTISNVSDVAEKWKTDIKSLLKLTGSEWEGSISSDKQYNSK